MNIRQLCVGIAIVWPVCIGLLLLYGYPDYPRTRTGWVMLVAFGPPAYLLTEWVAEWIFSEKHGKRISSKKFSLMRILFGVVVMAAILTVVIWVSVWTKR